MGWPDLAAVTAQLHDLGKYADQFQRRVRGDRLSAKDHSSAGAAVLITRYRQPQR